MVNWLNRLIHGDKRVAPTIGAVGPIPLESDSPDEDGENDDSKRPEVAAELTKDQIGADELIKAALELAQLMVTNQIGQAWDQASPVLKKLVDRVRFMDSIAIQRGSYGALVERRWASVTRYTVEISAQAPPGTYARVEFEVRFANQRQGREMVAFHLDERGEWRLSGYAITHAPPKAEA